MPTAPTDRRVRKTRKHLRDALVSLILEHGWDDVSVIDVCERADVGRSTFYLHFADKEDLLLSGFDELHEALHATHVKAVGAFAFVEPLIDHARENARLMRAVVGRKSGQAVQRRFRDVVNRLVNLELEALNVPAAVRGAVLRFVGGGLVELLLHWLENPKTGGAKTLSAQFRTLADAVIASARRP